MDYPPTILTYCIDRNGIVKIVWNLQTNKIQLIVNTFIFDLDDDLPIVTEIKLDMLDLARKNYQ